MRDQGASGLVSRKRGVPSNRRIEPAQREQFVGLVRERYADFGPELAREYLARDHGFGYSTETLRGWMIEAGLWKAKLRRAKRVHSPRERRAGVGELVQIDGSHHDWFEGCADKCCLIAFIDDATGQVLGAKFSPQETTEAYFAVLHEVVQRHGAPLALHSDRHGIFTKSDPEDPKPGPLRASPYTARSNATPDLTYSTFRGYLYFAEKGKFLLWVDTEGGRRRVGYNI